MPLEMGEAARPRQREWICGQLGKLSAGLLAALGRLSRFHHLDQPLELVGGAQMEIALRERDFDIVLLEQLPDAHVYVGADIREHLMASDEAGVRMSLRNTSDRGLEVVFQSE